MPEGQVPPFRIGNFPKNCVSLLLWEARRHKVRSGRALDLGSAVGRSSFELAQKIPEVVGVDFSKTFIQAAQLLARRGSLRFRLKLEGTISRPATVKVPAGKFRKRVRFQSADALRLPPLGKFDLVLVANLVDRVKDPKKLLQKVLPGLVRPGGLLLLTSPYTWSEEFTPRSRWLRESFSAIRKILSLHFRLLRRQDIPFLLREHRRKFQLSFADASVWQRLSA